MLALAVIVVIFVFIIPRFANYGDVWNTIRHISAPWLALLALGAVLNVATYAPNWMVALPGLTYPQSLRLTLSGTADFKVELLYSVPKEEQGSWVSMCADTT